VCEFLRRMAEGEPVGVEVTVDTEGKFAYDVQ
jgi:hypothetical protein